MRQLRFLILVDKIMFRFAVILTVLVGCQNPESRIAKLDSDAAKQMFLEQLFADDQELRQGQSSEIINTFGENSEAYKKFNDQFIRQDSINIIRTEFYFENYGYPAKAQLGDIACVAPWAVIHHSNDLDIRNRNFKCIFQGYNNGDIDDSAMSMYLGRSYEQTFGHRFEMPSPFKDSDRIEKLMEFLEFK